MKGDRRKESRYREEQYSFLDGWQPASNKKRRRKSAKPTAHQRRVAGQLGINLFARARRAEPVAAFLGDEVLEKAKRERGDS